MGLVKKGKDPEESKSEIIEIHEVAVSPKDGTITDKNGVQYTLSTLNPELKPTLFSNGKSYEVEVVKGKGGTLDIQKIMGEQVTTVPLISEPKAESPKQYVDKRGIEIALRGFIQASSIAASNMSLNPAEHAVMMESIFDNMTNLLKKSLDNVL
jgi:hypothetical protein